MSFHVIIILLFVILLASFALAADEDPFNPGDLPEELGDTGPFEYIFPELSPIATAATEYLTHRVLRSATRRLSAGNTTTEDAPSTLQPGSIEEAAQPPPSPYEANQEPAQTQRNTLPVSYDGVQQPFVIQENAILPSGYETNEQFWVGNTYTAGDRAQPVVAGSSAAPWLQQYPFNQFPNYPGPPPTLQPPPPPPPEWSTNTTDGNGPPEHNDQHRCGECGHTAQTRGKLRQHERCHIPKARRPHACPFCTQRFNFPREVRRHMSVHGLAPRYYCTVEGCRAARTGFARSDHLDRHLTGRHRG